MGLAAASYALPVSGRATLRKRGQPYRGEASNPAAEVGQELRGAERRGGRRGHARQSVSSRREGTDHASRRSSAQELLRKSSLLT